MPAEVVTSENRAEFMAHRMSTLSPIEPEAPKAEETPKEEPKTEVADEVVEAEDKHEEPRKKPRLEERFSELTSRAKAAEARAAAAEARAKELEEKANPKPVEKIDPDIGPEPKPTDYTDAFEYAKDLAKWSTDKALKDRDAQENEKEQKAQIEKTQRAWAKRVESIKAELPDYAEVLASADNLSVSDDVRDAIIESEVGPRVLYHLAQNADLVEKLNGMTVRAALREVGKLEAKFEKAEEPKKEDPKPVTKIAAVRPPEPIAPIRATGATDNKVDNRGEFQGSYSEWKALRKAGKV